MQYGGPSRSRRSYQSFSRSCSSAAFTARKSRPYKKQITQTHSAPGRTRNRRPGAFFQFGLVCAHRCAKFCQRRVVVTQLGVDIAEQDDRILRKIGVHEMPPFIRLVSAMFSAFSIYHYTASGSHKDMISYFFISYDYYFMMPFSAIPCFLLRCNCLPLTAVQANKFSFLPAGEAICAHAKKACHPAAFSSRQGVRPSVYLIFGSSGSSLQSRSASAPSAAASHQ